MRINTWVITGLLSLTFSYGALGVVERKVSECGDLFFQAHYPALKTDEPAIDRAFEKMVNLSGSTRVSNCTVQFPSENGVAVKGERRVSFDKQWYRVVFINGLKKEELQRHGMEIIYNLREGQLGGEVREVTGLRICRTHKLCNEMGIPHQPASAEDKPLDLD